MRRGDSPLSSSRYGRHRAFVRLHGLLDLLRDRGGPYYIMQG